MKYEVQDNSGFFTPSLNKEIYPSLNYLTSENLKSRNNKIEINNIHNNIQNIRDNIQSQGYNNNILDTKFHSTQRKGEIINNNISTDLFHTQTASDNIFIYQGKNIQNSTSYKKIYYYPSIISTKNEDILGSESDGIIFDIKHNNNNFSFYNRENLIKNQNQIIKVPNLKDKNNNFKKVMKTSNSFDYNIFNIRMNKLWKSNESRMEVNLLNNNTKMNNDNCKKKKSLINENENKNKFNNYKYKEINIPLNIKKNPLVTRTENSQPYNIIIQPNENNEGFSRQLNTNNVIMDGNNKNIFTYSSNMNKSNNIIDKYENVILEKYNDEVIKNNEINSFNYKNQKILNNNLNYDNQNKIYLNDNSIQNQYIYDSVKNQNIGKNIIIKRDLSNKNNSSIYISRNNKSYQSTNKYNTNIIQNAINNSSIYVSNYNKKNDNNNIIVRENLPISNTNIKNTTNINIPSILINNNYNKNNIEDNNNFMNISQDKNNNNNELYLSVKNEKQILNNKDKINIVKNKKVEGRDNNNNLDLNNNNILSQVQNNFININIKVNQEENLINKISKRNVTKSNSDIKIINQKYLKSFCKINNKILNKPNKLNKQNKSFIKNISSIINHKNIIPYELLNKNNSNKNLFNKNGNKNHIIHGTYCFNNKSNNKNNLSNDVQINKKLNKIIVQNVIIENNASNNNIFFSNNGISPNNYLINSIKEPIVEKPKENKKIETNYISTDNNLIKPKKLNIKNIDNNLIKPKILNIKHIEKIVSPLNKYRLIYKNLNNLNYKIKKSEFIPKTKNNEKNTQQKQQKQNIIQSSSIEKKHYSLNHSNSDYLQRHIEKVISSDKNSSSKVVMIKDSEREKKMKEIAERNKSILANRPKAECPICHKLIETHLLLIHTNAHPSQVFDWLFLGTFTNACDNEELKRINIKYILNCAIECNNNNIPKNIKELHLKVRDDKNFDIIPFFKQSNDFINKARESGNNILIHCKAGISRSATFAIAYLIEYFGYDFNSALELIKKHRDRINPNDGFIKQLKQYEKTVKNNSKIK